MYSVAWNGRVLDVQRCPTVAHERPTQVQGVNAQEDSAVVIRARIKVRPGYQWGIRHQFNHLMKNRFDELDTEIPFPPRPCTLVSM